MKNKMLALGVAAIFAMTGIVSANLLTNPGFETGDITGWSTTLSGGSAAASTAYARSGTYSLVIDSTGAGDWASPNVDQTYAASAGQEINLSGWMLNPSATPISGASFGLFKIEFLDGAANILEPASVSIGGSAAAPFFGAESNPFLNSGSAVDTWIFSETQAVAPVGTASIRLLALNVNQPGNLGPMYYDDISATVIPEPATMGLLGIFGGGLLFFRRRLKI